MKEIKREDQILISQFLLQSGKQNSFQRSIFYQSQAISKSINTGILIATLASIKSSMKQIQPTILFSLLFIAVLSSCKISDELQYKGFNNFKLSGDTKNPSVGVDVTLYNPNPIGVKIKTMNLTVDVNHSQLGTIGLDDPVKLKSKQNFTLPIMMETSMDQLQTLTKPGLQSLLFDKPLAFEISGTITLRKFIFKKTYDFNYADELNVKDIKTK